MKTEKEQEYLDRIAELEKELKRTHHKIKKDTYGLHWLDVPEAFEDDVENKLPILKEVKDKAIVNDDGKPTHILIEGDNYHALTCLNYTHKGKIDVIYIDPPYNTGKDEFRYKDKRLLDKYPDGTDVPKDHPLRHSYWLSFMNKRLELAKSLLSEDGIIMINIDDNEFAQLKILCDQLFGANNHLMTLFVQVRYAEKTLVEDMGYQKLLEQVLIYGKSPFANLKKQTGPYEIEKFKWFIKETGHYDTIELGGKRVDIFKEGTYEIEKGEPSLDGLKEIWASGAVLDGNSSGRFFRDYLENRKADDGLKTLYKVYDIGSDKFDFRYFTGPKRTNATKGKYYQGVPNDVLENIEDYKKEKTIINYMDFSDNFGNCRHEGGVEFRSGKKPIDFLNHLLKLSLIEHKQNTVLDFFAGSGSFGHCILENNSNSNRSDKFILITNDENGIMSEKCYPRINNVINGWGNNSGLGNSAKYFKIEFVGDHNIIGATDQDKTELAHHASAMLAIAENTLYEMDEYQNQFYQFFHNEKHYTAVYFREELEKFEEFRGKVLALDKPITVYVFSWGENEFADQFDDRNDIEVKPIPQPILEVYKTIYNLSG